MTAPGLLDFFVLEASDYLEQLDRQLAGGGRAPDYEGVQRSARGLRGSATMARLSPLAELANAVERVARAARDGRLTWDQAIGSAVVGVVDEWKSLLHVVRQWSDAETERARSRTAELLRFMPEEGGAGAAGDPAAAGTAYVSHEAANVAAGLELLLTAPASAGGPGLAVLQRIRALRGLAAIRDVPALADTLEAAEQAAAPLEEGQALGPGQRDVLQRASRLLRDIALAVRAGRSTDHAALEALEQALDAWLDEQEGSADRIVAIDSLFHTDAGPHVVTATPNPPTTAAQRFRLEMVSNGEHLRLLVEEARSADPAARARFRRHIRRALRAIRRTAESFGERAVAEALTRIDRDVATVDAASLDRLTAVARSLAAAGSPAALAAALDEPAAAPAADAAPTATVTPAVPEPATATRAEAPTPARAEPPVGAPAPAAVRPPVTPSPAGAPAADLPRRRTPSGSDLAALLDQGLTGVGTITARPMVEPVPLEETPVVPVTALVYRGKSALRRALELRDEMRETGGAPDPAAIDELFDLIELALVD